MQAINARPIKKIAEAKARKKLKAVKRWEQIKQKAEVIADSNAPDSEKLNAIKKLYKGKLDKRTQKVPR